MADVCPACGGSGKSRPVGGRGRRCTRCGGTGMILPPDPRPTPLGIQLRELKMTCAALPSAWEGVTEDGREIYVKYRYGRLRVRVDNVQVYLRDFHDPLHGIMSTVDMLEQTGLVLFDGGQMDDGDLARWLTALDTEDVQPLAVQGAYTEVRLGLADVRFALQGDQHASVLWLMKPYRTWEGMLLTPEDAEALGKRLLALAAKAREIGRQGW